jgi:hypothetical protein
VEESLNQDMDLDREAEEKRLLHRLEELHQSLYQLNAPRQTETLDTLLSMLWVLEGKARLLVACVLCGYAPRRGNAASAPAGPARLSARLERSQPAHEILPPPGTRTLQDAGLAERIGLALIATLTQSLDTLKAELRASAPDAPHIREEAEVCLSMLGLARRLQTEGVSESCLRLLHLFPPDLARSHGPLARLTARLREAAAQTLGALSPDALFAFWYALGSPDIHARHDLLPVLDYLSDSRAIPYLIRLLERRTQWADRDVVGWFVVRAMEHIGDRSALPALRRIAAGGAAPLQETHPREILKAPPVSAELVREAERVIEAIEWRKNQRERASLLRPAHLSPADLLRPAMDASEEETRQDREELLRPEGEV